MEITDREQKALLKDLERKRRLRYGIQNDTDYTIYPPSRSPRFASEAGNSPPVRVGMPASSSWRGLATGGDSERNSASARFFRRHIESRWAKRRERFHGCSAASGSALGGKPVELQSFFTPQLRIHKKINFFSNMV
jgi:hypothetical protein